MTINTNAALAEYANPLNWDADANGVRRIWLEPGSDTPNAYNGFEIAREALTSAAAVPPEGWVMVPVEPTPEMVHAVRFAGAHDAPAIGAEIVAHETVYPFVGEAVATRMCRAMLAAAPKAEPVPADKRPQLSALFREALAWGMTYGPEIPAQQWDELRESMVDQYTDRAMRAQAAPQQEPVAFVSPEQFAQLSDPEDESGKYLPTRKTSAGKFTLALYATPQPAVQQGDDADLARTIDQRDTAEGWADGLAGLIGKYFGQEIGEHSSAHNPWQEARDIIEEALAVQAHPAAPVAQGDAEVLSMSQALFAQRAADARDAARYRYLTRSVGDYCITYADEDGGGVLKGGAADAAIDAARAQAASGQPPA